LEYQGKQAAEGMMKENNQRFADWLIEQRELPSTNANRKGFLYGLIRYRVYHRLAKSGSWSWAQTSQYIFDYEPPQQIYEFCKARIPDFDDFLTECIREFEDKWGFQPAIQPILLDLSDKPLCSDAWEFHEKVLRTLPDDILTTTDQLTAFNAWHYGFTKLIPSHYEGLRDLRGYFNKDCEERNEHNCVFEVYDKWWHALTEQHTRTFVYTSGEDTTEIQIILPMQIWSDESHVSELDRDPPEQPPAQVEPEAKPAENFSNSQILIDFSSDDLCMEAWEFHEWIYETYHEVLTTTNTEEVEQVIQAIKEERDRRERAFILSCGCEILIKFKWDEALYRKWALLDLYSPSEKTNIRVVPAMHILPRGSHVKPAQQKNRLSIYAKRLSLHNLPDTYRNQRNPCQNFWRILRMKIRRETRDER